MLSSSTKSFTLKNSLRHKVETVSTLFSSLERIRFGNDDSLSETEIILAASLAIDLSHDIFFKNIHFLGLTDQNFLFELLNKFDLWGPEAAVKFLLKDSNQLKLLVQNYSVGHRSSEFLNTIIMIASPTLVEESMFVKIKEAQIKKIPISMSWSLEGILAYLKKDR